MSFTKRPLHSFSAFSAAPFLPNLVSARSFAFRWFPVCREASRHKHSIAAGTRQPYVRLRILPYHIFCCSRRVVIRKEGASTFTWSPKLKSHWVTYDALEKDRRNSRSPDSENGKTIRPIFFDQPVFCAHVERCGQFDRFLLEITLKGRLFIRKRSRLEKGIGVSQFPNRLNRKRRKAPWAGQ